MKRSGTWKHVWIALTVLAPVLAASAQDVPGEGEASFTEAWIRGDTDEMRAARERFAELVAQAPDSAQAHYLLGLAEMTDVVLTNGAPDGRDMDATLAALDRAQEHLARAFELDATQADACATTTFCILLRFMLGSAGPEQGPLMGQWLERGMQAGSERSSVRLLSTWLSTGRNMTTPEEIDRATGLFVELAEEIRARVESEARAPDYWDLMGQAMAARALLFSPRPRPRLAAGLTEALLERQPDFRMARDFLLPFVTVHAPLEPGSWRDRDWEELGGELELDGRTPGLADAVAVAGDRDDEALWLLIHLAQEPDARLFGINLVIDEDDSQETGSPWWGGDMSFVFDRLVSVWVAQDDEGRYRGAVGVTDDEGAIRGEMTNLSSGTVGFALDSEENAFVLRVPWADLGNGDSTRFRVAVGSNAAWNDDLPDSEGFLLER